MKKLTWWLIVWALLLTACGAAESASEPMAMDAAATEEPMPTQANSQPDDASNIQVLPTVTAKPLPSATIPLTKTSLPPLVLPSPQPGAPEELFWDGLPTDPVGSLPGMYFRLTYDTQFWALTEDQFGQPALGHRGIPYCVISVVQARGLPLNWRVDHEMRLLGITYYEVSLAYEADVLRFVNYLGGDGQIFTSFQVSFEESIDVCLRDAEVVFATLTSVPEAEATVTP